MKLTEKCVTPNLHEVIAIMVTEQDPVGPSWDRATPMSSACLLSVENFSLLGLP